MTTKALTARQARWAEVLSRYYFRIMYKPGSTNCADALTWREQDTDRQKAVTSTLCIQALLCLEQLDPRILEEMQQFADVYKIGTPDPTPDSGPESGLDLIDDLLQANRTTEALQA